MGETSFFAGILAIKIEHMGGFVLHIHEFGYAGLHAKCHLILRYAGVDLRIAGFLLLGLVDLGDAV